MLDLSSSMVDFCEGAAESNPDISGVGVRISFYLQLFMLVFLVDRSWEDAPAALWTFTTTSAGLTIAAIVQWNQDKLSLFQALQVSNLVWLANIGSFLALASYSRKRKADQGDADHVVKWVSMGQTLISMALTLAMWARVETFGNARECNNEIVYVVMFAVGLPVLESGRLVGLSISSILTAIYLAVSAHEIYSHWKARKFVRPRQRQWDEEALADPTTTIPMIEITIPYPERRSTPSPLPDRHRASISSYERHGHRSPHFDDRGRASHRPKRRSWLQELDPMLVGIIAAQLFISVYFIVTSEMLLQLNDSVGSAAEWGFGQIFAIVVCLPSAMAVFNAFMKNGLKNGHKKKKKPEQNGAHCKCCSAATASATTLSP